MRLPGAYLSWLSGCNVAGPAAVFAITVAIAIKLLSAVLAGQCIKGLLVDFLLVAIPPSHPAAVRTELLLPATLGLYQGVATVPATLFITHMPVAVDMGSYGAGRKSQLGSNHRRTVPL